MSIDSCHSRFSEHTESYEEGSRSEQLSAVLAHSWPTATWIWPVGSARHVFHSASMSSDRPLPPEIMRVNGSLHGPDRMLAMASAQLGEHSVGAPPSWQVAGVQHAILSPSTRDGRLP